MGENGNWPNLQFVAEEILVRWDFAVFLKELALGVGEALRMTDSALVQIPLKRRYWAIRFADEVDVVSTTPSSDPRGSGSERSRTHANIHFLSTRNHFIRFERADDGHDCAESDEARGEMESGAREETARDSRNPHTTFPQFQFLLFEHFLRRHDLCTGALGLVR